MAPQTKTATRAKRRVVSPAEKRIQVRLTVDSKFTKTHFSQLFAVLKIRKQNALAEHIVMNFKSKAAQAQLLRSITTSGRTFHFKASTPLLCLR
jgi:hypothetical protein